MDFELNNFLKLQDLKYKEFISKLIPNISSENIVGIRTPVLREYIKKLNNEEKVKFLNNLPHKYYEENNIHGLILNSILDYDEFILEINKFLPYIDNWATCDIIRPKFSKKNLDIFYYEIKKWLNSKHTYTVRFAIEMLMIFYLDEHFKEEHLKIVANIKTDEYYIKMMIAWYFATAMDKQYEKTIIYIENKKLDKFTHNKAIQKSIESNKIKDDVKKYLKTLKIKGEL